MRSTPGPRGWPSSRRHRTRRWLAMGPDRAVNARCIRSAGRRPVPVDDPIASGGEQPGPEAVLVTFERRERAQGPEPSVRREVLGHRAGLDGQVPEQTGLEFRPERGEGVLVAPLGDARRVFRKSLAALVVVSGGDTGLTIPPYIPLIRSHTPKEGYVQQWNELRSWENATNSGGVTKSAPTSFK